MSHVHGDMHGHDVDRAYGTGALVALVALVILAAIAFGLLWTQPWDDDDSPNTPGITEPLEGGGVDNPVDDGVDNPVDGDGGVDNPVEEGQ